MGEFEIQGPEHFRIRKPFGDVPATGAGEPASAGLQSLLGNATVSRMIHREPAPEEDEIQPKFDLSLAQRAEDEMEEDVDRSADTSLAQRAPEVGLAGGAVSDNVAGRIDGMRGGGSPLDDTTKSTMEGALGTSLSGVRVHVGAESDELNHAITAKAFTTGNDVFVRSDQWAPGSSSTQRLMAHELTHVAQQSSGIASGGGGMNVGAADTAEEREADDVAEAVAQRTLQRSSDHEMDDEHAH